MVDQIEEEVATMDHIKLGHSPLVRVLAQLRWPTLSTFVIADVAQKFGQRVADKYPIPTLQTEFQIVISPQGAQQQAAGELHQFASADDTWKVTLGSTFISLETSVYAGHNDFILRFGEVIDALGDCANIPVWTRLGYRYTNRIGVGDFSELRDLFLANVLPGLNDLSPNADFALVQGSTEEIYQAGTSGLLVRSALLAPGTTNDPTLEPISTKSLVLDFDAFSEVRSVDFSRSAVESSAQGLAEIAYRHFDTVVTSSFRERYK